MIVEPTVHQHMAPSTKPICIPDIILIIGTDAAGKDHVANIIEQMIGEAGYAVEKRKSFLSGKITRNVSSTEKNSLQLVSERVFLWLYPFIGFLLPSLLNLFLKVDLKRLKRSDNKEDLHTILKALFAGPFSIRRKILFCGRNNPQPVLS